MKLLTNISNGLRGVMLFMISLYCGVASGTDYYCDFSVNGIYYQFVSGTTDEVAVSYDNYETGRYGGNYTNYSGNISVPATVIYNGKTYKVTAVSSHAFQECAVTQVNLPSTIKTIGASAFLDCYQLTKINLPDAITSINAGAFNGCTALTNVTLPSVLKEIGSSAFAMCRTFTSIVIPEGVTSIGSSAFYGCNNLSSISIPNSVVSVGDWAFNETAWYSNLPDGVVYIGKIAYCYKGSMPENTAIKINEGTISISNNAFKNTNCINMVSISIPNSVTNIGAYAFYGCAGLTTIDIPSDVETINSFTFYGCTKLESINISNHVTCIDTYAFSGCKNLSTVNIPNSVTSIGANAFGGCSGLTSVTVGSGVTTIGDYAFQNCTNLTSFELKNGVTSIGDYTFEGCTGLTTINLPNSIIAIGSNAFYGTAWYDYQPEGIVYVGKVAYCYKGTMSDETSISIKAGTLGIATSAFSNYTLLTSVTLPSSLQKIGVNAFYGCSNLTSVTALMEVPIPIESHTFSYRNFATLNVPNGCKAAYEAADYWKEFKEIVEQEPEPIPVISINTVNVRRGKNVGIAIDLTNDSENLTAFQFDLTLPDGIVLAKNDNGKYQISKTNRFADDNQTLNVSLVEGNTYRVLCFSMENSAITGNTGTVLNAVLQVNKEMAAGQYEGKIENIVFTKTDGTVLKQTDTTFDIEVKNLITGDANDDEEVNVGDIVEIVSYIMGSPSSKFVIEAADCNGDGEINVGDIVAVVSIIMNTNVSSSPALIRRAQETSERLWMKEKDNKDVSFCMKNSSGYVAAQMDVRLDKGQTLNAVTLNSALADSHLMTCQQIASGSYRIVVYSMDNETFAQADEELLTLQVSGGNVDVDNILFVTSDQNIVGMRAIRYTSTGISSTTRQQQPEVIFDLQGHPWTGKQMQKGIYIINGRKQVIK